MPRSPSSILRDVVKEKAIALTDPGRAELGVLICQGDVIAGKYVVGRVLGQGGMGVVVTARHEQLHHDVALKFLLPGAVASPEVVARFMREARVAAKIRSEHVARVLDVDTLPGGAPYLVMELLEGEDLKSVITGHGVMPIRQAVGCVLEACEAIAEAHSLGIVHRDLKPANLFLARHPSGRSMTKVLDFGISKAPAVSNEMLTNTHGMLGSPAYMSPEQIKSPGTVDARTDIWSLGVVLYELLAAKFPFDATSASEAIAKILYQPPIPLRTRRYDVPSDLEDAIMRCLEKDPSCRFQDVGELAIAIARYAPTDAAGSATRIANVLAHASEPAHVQTMAVFGTGAGITSLPALSVPTGATVARSRSAHVALLVAATAATIVAAVTGLGVLAWRSGSSSSPQSDLKVTSPDDASVATTVEPAPFPIEPPAPHVEPSPIEPNQASSVDRPTDSPESPTTMPTVEPLSNAEPSTDAAKQALPTRARDEQRRRPSSRCGLLLQRMTIETTPEDRAAYAKECSHP